MLSLCCNGLDYKNRRNVSCMDVYRAYALIDVLRNADTAVVPLDLIYLYLAYTEPFFGLGCIIFRELVTEDEDNVRRVIQNINVPKGLSTMASRYLTRCCKAHIHSILQMTDLYTPALRTKDFDWETTRCYPIIVGQALDRLAIPNRAELKEVKHIIDALHSALCPVLTREMRDEYERQKVPLTRQQNGKLVDLCNLLTYTVDRDESCFDSYTRGTLCNLLEILLVLNTRSLGYLESLCFKEIQGFNRTFAEDRGVLKPILDKNVPVLNEFDIARNTIDKSLAVLGKLSPQAALCLGTGVDAKMAVDGRMPNDFLRQLGGRQLSCLLDALNNSSRETYLFVKYELMTEQCILQQMKKNGDLGLSTYNTREG